MSRPLSTPNLIYHSANGAFQNMNCYSPAFFSWNSLTSEIFAYNYNGDIKPNLTIP